MYGYLAWVPDSDSSLPFDLKSDGYEETWQLRSDSIAPTVNAPLTFFVATFPEFGGPYTGAGFELTANATIVECRLINATYSSSYRWTNGIRDLNVTVTPSGKSIPYPGWVQCNRYLFVNSFPPITDIEHITPQPVSEYNNTVIQNYAYASVIDAFMKLLKGSIYYPGTEDGLVISTDVMSTPLGTTQELVAVQSQSARGMKALDALGPQYWPGVSVKLQANSTLSLRPTLELMFQNLTMSLMSSPLLQSVILSFSCFLSSGTMFIANRTSQT